MDMTAPHFGFVIAAFALTFLCITALIAITLRRDRATRQRLGKTTDTSRS